LTWPLRVPCSANWATRARRPPILASDL